MLYILSEGKYNESNNTVVDVVSQSLQNIISSARIVIAMFFYNLKCITAFQAQNAI